MEREATMDSKDVIGHPVPDPPDLEAEDLPREVTLAEMFEHLHALRLPGGIPREMTLASCAAILRRTGPPERLENLVADLRDRGGLELMSGDGGESLEELARTAWTALRHLEENGVEWDPEREVATVPNGRAGRNPKLVVDEVGAAREQVPGDGYTDRETLAAIRERLEGLLPPEELTDAKIKRRVQVFYER